MVGTVAISDHKMSYIKFLDKPLLHTHTYIYTYIYIYILYTRHIAKYTSCQQHHQKQQQQWLWCVIRVWSQGARTTTTTNAWRHRDQPTPRISVCLSVFLFLADVALRNIIFVFVPLFLKASHSRLTTCWMADMIKSNLLSVEYELKKDA